MEEYGPDAVSILGYLAATTEHVELGTAIMQIGTGERHPGPHPAGDVGPGTLAGDAGATRRTW
ncbi:hypothetical protein ACFVGY_04060 [Streptomyces sp. NPDC127106]|uniref:hypothetical protein n=1 Tax=Streptomyces sp. NPDC127106 TaxID=3345360 RepID=UPI003627A667